MACFRIMFASPDPYNPMNGPHVPVQSGAEFLAKYGDGLQVDQWEPSDEAFLPRPLEAADLDGLDVGGVLRIMGDFGEVLTVDRTQ